MMRACTLIVSLLLATCAAMADSSQLLLDITSDRDSLLGQLFVEVGPEGQATGLRVHRGEGGEAHFTSDQVAQGVLLQEEKDRPIVTLRSHGLGAKGGPVTLRYLYSGVPPSTYRSLSLELRRQGDRWQLYPPGSETPVQGLYFVVHRVLVLGVIGIKEVRLRQPGLDHASTAIHGREDLK